MSKKDVLCNICNSDNCTELFAEGKAQIHRIVKCNVCGLIYANPQTNNVSGVEEMYEKSKGLSDEEALKNFTPDKIKYLKKQYLQLKDYAKIIDFVECETKGTFLEIGSFAGVFLSEVKKRGWNVIGLEPLEIPALYAEKLGVKTIREYFINDTISKNSVDVISSCHVIEHVPDPSSFIKNAHEVLKPRGKLILETPSYDSLLFRLLGHRERSVRCDGHLFFFTKKTLRKLVEANGFKVLKHEKVGRTLTLDRLLYNFGVISGKRAFFNRLAKKLKLENKVIRLNTRDMQRIYCEKL